MQMTMFMNQPQSQNYESVLKEEGVIRGRALRIYHRHRGTALI